MCISSFENTMIKCRYIQIKNLVYILLCQEKEPNFIPFFLKKLFNNNNILLQGIIHNA